MSGHSKWAQIKRKKSLVDEARGRLFSKLAREIQLAARGGADQERNVSLRAAIAEAKAANMPLANIERAIRRGGGEDRDAQTLEEVYYEAYGPGGAAILIRALTDNRNRTVAGIKSILAKNSASLAEAGSVRWQFDEHKKARFALNLDEKDKAVLNDILSELEDQEDIQAVFTNVQRQ